MVAIGNIKELLEFLEDAKSDDSFQMALSDILKANLRASERSPLRREPIEIPPNLTNQQIRDLLARDLSRAELAEIAKQRSISHAKRSREELRAAIMSFVDRQEDYNRLRG